METKFDVKKEEYYYRRKNNPDRPGAGVSVSVSAYIMSP